MKAFVAGFILGIAALVTGVWMYFSSGRAPVAVTEPSMPFEKLLARTALRARIGKENPKEPPIPADDANLLAGAKIYKENCALCHGLPDQPKTAIAEGLYPRPPQLLHGVGVTDDPAWETYWKATNGIRLTGMPGFNGKLTETQLWQVSQLLAHADKLSDGVKKTLTESSAGGSH
jgi:thiosulfate dehydrogenase